MSYVITADCTGCTACIKICPVAAIRGERKQLHVIDPAVCIDCGACGRICPYDSILDQHSNLCRPLKRSLWPKPVVAENLCISCGVCLEVCPTGVLDFSAGTNNTGHTLAYLRDATHCIGCAFCEVACPVEAITMDQPGKGK